jgi:hypothetical protein
MSDDRADLILEILKNIQQRLTRVEDAQNTTNRRLSALDAHLVGFHTTGTSNTADIDELKLRLDRIEKRLDLVE